MINKCPNCGSILSKNCRARYDTENEETHIFCEKCRLELIIDNESGKNYSENFLGKVAELIMTSN